VMIKPTRGNSSPKWNFTSSPPAALLPTARLIEKAFVPHHGFMTGATHGTLQQFHNVLARAPVDGSTYVAFLDLKSCALKTLFKWWIHAEWYKPPFPI